MTATSERPTATLAALMKRHGAARITVVWMDSDRTPVSGPAEAVWAEVTLDGPDGNLLQRTYEHVGGHRG